MSAISFAEKSSDSDQKLIDVAVDKGGDFFNYNAQVIEKENTLYIKDSDLAEITRYKYSCEDDKCAYVLGNKYVIIDYDTDKLTVNNIPQALSETVSKDGTHYLPLAEMLPWLNVTASVENGILCVSSDPVSFWEASDQYNAKDYSFNLLDIYGDSTYDTVSLILMESLDCVFNFDSLWKRLVRVSSDDKSDKNTIFAYETYYDCLKEFAVPDENDTAGIADALSAISSKLSPVSKIAGFAEKAGKYFDDKEFGEELVEIYSDYPSTEDNALEVLKSSGKVIKYLKSGFTYLQIMMSDTENYAKAVDYIYLSDKSNANGAEVKAAKKAEDILTSKFDAIADASSDVIKDYFEDAGKDLITETLEDVSEDALYEDTRNLMGVSLGAYIKLIDNTLSLVWPVNKAYSELSKLNAYTEIQEISLDAYYRAKDSETLDADTLLMAEMSAIISMKAATKCYDAMDKLFNCFGGDDILEQRYSKLRSMITDFELCSTAIDHDAICDKKTETEELKEDISDLKIKKDSLALSEYIGKTVKDVRKNFGEFTFDYFSGGASLYYGKSDTDFLLYQYAESANDLMLVQGIRTSSDAKLLGNLKGGMTYKEIKSCADDSMVVEKPTYYDDFHMDYMSLDKCYVATVDCGCIGIEYYWADDPDVNESVEVSIYLKTPASASDASRVIGAIDDRIYIATPYFVADDMEWGESLSTYTFDGKKMDTIAEGVNILFDSGMLVASDYESAVGPVNAIAIGSKNQMLMKDMIWDAEIWDGVLYCLLADEDDVFSGDIEVIKIEDEDMTKISRVKPDMEYTSVYLKDDLVYLVTNSSITNEDDSISYLLYAYKIRDGEYVKKTYSD